MLRRILALLTILAAVPAGAGVVCSSTNKSCGGGSSGSSRPNSYTVATLPASPNAGDVAAVTDGATTANGCTVGGGSTILYCRYTGSAWAPFGDGNSGAAPDFSAITAGTNAAALVVGTGGSLAVSGSGTIAATTAAALAANPSDCGVGTKATGIAANGNLTCSAVDQAADITGTTPVANGGTNLTAAADDNVMVGNGTTWQTKAIGDCDDSGGNHLNYDTTTNAFSCGTSSSGGGGGAPTDATYITQTANGSLSAEQALGALSTGCLGSATTTGVVSARTITGTSNEVSVSNGDCSGNPTLSLPATINLGGKTSLQIPNAAAPTTSTFGEIAGDNNAWAASRGAVQFYDGTANTYLVGALASDTPSNGQVPTWNTGGTVTWETPSAGGITIGDTQVAYATAANTVGGEAGMTYTAASNALTLGVADTDGGSLTVNATLGSELAPTLTGATTVNWTFGSGYATPLSSSIDKNANGTNTIQPTAALSITAGTTYKVVITLSACSVCTPGTVGATYTLGNVLGSELSAATTYTDYITAANTANFIITPTNTSRFTISSISIKALTLGTITTYNSVTDNLVSTSGRGMRFYSNQAATAGTDVGFNFIAIPNPATADPVFAVNSNGSTTGSLMKLDTSGLLTLNVTSGALSARGVTLNNGDTITWTSAGKLQSSGAGTFILGGAAAASPVAQVVQAQASRSGTDTNTAGGSLTIAAGLGTGNSAPAILALQAGGLSPTSGTTAQSARTRLGLGATKVLTNNTAIDILSATEAAISTTVGGIGGKLDYCIEVTDGTNGQQECGNVTWQGVNKAGAFTNSVTEVSTQQLSAGTLTTTWAISGANPALISINANSSLTPSTGFPRITYNYSNLSQQSISVQ